MNFDERTKLNILFDFYGELLTNKQKDIFKMYYEEDFSLGEIAEEFNITRQAVYDVLKRVQKSLNEYESKLKLVDRFDKKKKEIEDIYIKLKNVEMLLDGKNRHIVKDIIDEFNDVLNGNS